MSQMDQTTQQAAANSEETSSAAEELAAQSQELTSLVGKFELGSSVRAAARKPARAMPSRRVVPPALPKTNGHASNGNGHGNGHAFNAKALIPIESDPDFREF